MSQSQEAPPPVLRFIPSEKILPHEEADRQRFEPLMKRIVDSGIWLHPPIVAPLPESDGYYVILDGANRCHSIKALEYPHILVQVTGYDSGQVRLDTWHHIVNNLRLEEFLDDIHAIERVNVYESDLLSAKANLAQRNILSYIYNYNTKNVYSLQLSDHSLHTRNAALRSLVTTYKHRGKLDRVNFDDIDAAQKLFPDADAMIIFPHYEPSEILVAARDNEPLPPGISRHIIQGRAMRLNYPLEALKSETETTQEKNEALQTWMLEKIAGRAVRFYAESTYMFDE